METQSKANDKTKPGLRRFGWAWLIALLVIALGGWGIGWFDNATELTPDHSDQIFPIWIGAAGVAAVISALVGFFQSTGHMLRRLLTGVVCLGIIGAASVTMVLMHTADLVWMAIDFPPAKTQTHAGRLLISRAYHTHGKTSAAAHIQTMPIWSDMDITDADYAFMQAHRRPDDHGADPDEIASDGYFCATVTLQTSGDAIRVLHAGNGELPDGTIGLCPAGAR